MCSGGSAKGGRKKAASERDKLAPLLEPAIQMFHNGDTAKRIFTVNHIKAMLLFVFVVEPKKTGNKADWRG